MGSKVSDQLDELIFGVSESQEESELEKFFSDKNDSSEEGKTKNVEETSDEKLEEQETTDEEVVEDEDTEESTESETAEEQDEVTKQNNELREEIRQLKIQMTQNNALQEHQLNTLRPKQQVVTEQPKEIPQEEFIKTDDAFDKVITDRGELNKLLNQIVNHALGHANKNIQYVVTKIPEILETVSTNNRNDEAAANQFFRDNKDLLTVGIKTESDSLNRRSYLKVLLNQIAAEGKITDRIEMLKEMGKRARAQLGIQENVVKKQVNRTVKKVDLTKGKGSASGKVKTQEVANSLADEIELLAAI